MKFKKLFNKNKLLFGFYIGMFVQQSINTFVDYNKEKLFVLSFLLIVILIGIGMIWIIGDSAKHSKPKSEGNK